MAAFNPWSKVQDVAQNNRESERRTRLGLHHLVLARTVLHNPNVEFPIFQDLPQWPTPFGTLFYTEMIMLEGAKATTETVDALRSGAAAMKAMQKATNIDDVDKTMDEINEQTENMKQIQEALATPIGAAADFDEDELEAELEELESAELEEELLQPATTAPAAPVHTPAGRQPARAAPQKRTAEEDELAALQAEMAL